jgi:aspartate/methionine/tyrosine aminotransferase
VRRISRYIYPLRRKPIPGDPNRHRWLRLFFIRRSRRRGEEMTIRDFKLERFMAEYEFRAPYVLGASDCETVSVQELLTLEPDAEHDLLRLRLGYVEPAGTPPLREAIASLYSTISPEEIITFNGASEGILAFMNAALQPQDHVIVQFPAYQSLYEVARSIGCDVSFWRMHEEDGWRPDPDHLAESIRGSTKVIVINSPHNPTGYQLSLKDFRAIAEVARDHDITVFSDEVYRLLEHRANDRLPPFADISESGVSLGVVSKAFGLPGLRTGWIATHDRDLLRRLAAFKDYSTICNSGPSEFFAALALRHSGRIVARNIDIVRENLRLLDRFFSANGDLFSWVHPAAGSTAFPRMLMETSSREFCIDLVERYGVMLLPGTVFDYDDAHLRIGYGRMDMPEALARFEAYLSERFR